ncbi:two-component sensor [Methylophaga lonarensis MPL]|uniref:histidine kinase n=1 Tax=Methylophaga lonarensis MPL TaxID=1286106 RepID=M7PQN9_9GAMM|nr:HAMP domain-containing sensor histidine kinase [Methylophaga lonarensis]EMR12749.1 two-component sensor [Methylophaga lonarensis MPL]
MKRPLSLKRLFTLSFLVFGLLVMIGYSLLSIHFFVRGMDNIVSGAMENAALAYFATHPDADMDESVIYRGARISRDWQQLPEEIRSAFNRPPASPGELLKHDASGWLQRPDIMHFVLRIDINDQPVFISRSMSRDSVSPLMGRNMAESLQLLLLFSLLSALTLIVITGLLLRHISRPVARLGQWTRQLTAEQLEQPVPDFMYPELNEMAQLTRNSLISVNRSLQREHQFLRYASHELRTPISVIRNNIELMSRWQQKQSETLPPVLKEITDRIDRASLNMHHLTETLLWMSRDISSPLPEQTLDLEQTLTQLVEDMRYLLRDKQVSVDIDCSPCTVSVSEVALRIVLGNLIRNAFQHTWQGEVTIQQQDTRISIVNHLYPEQSTPTTESGFGLGLQLTAQLTEKLGWYYRNEALGDGHRVTLDISPQAPLFANQDL